MSSIIKLFPPGTWVEDWPHKINLDEHPLIVERLNSMAAASIPESRSHTRRKTTERRMNWLFNYIDQLGNDAFLEIGQTSGNGWVLFHTDDEVLHFMLSHYES